MSKTKELREKINDQMVAALESGSMLPWRRPWRISRNAGLPANAVSKKPYRGINPVLLDIASMRHRFTSRWWATWNQWKSAGGVVQRRPAGVREGEWGTTIIYWSPVTKTINSDEGDEEEERFFVMRSYVVFNVDQVDGPFDHLRAGHGEAEADAPVIDYQPAEEVIEATGADVRFGGGKAFYSPSGDYIQCPPRSAFNEADEYYETLFHELVHWTEHPGRLNWSRKEKDNCYSMGELIAELGSCYLAREVGVPASENLDNHVAYLGNWLKAMKGDSSFIFRASAQASKASDYILSFSRVEMPQEELAEALAC